MSEAKSPPSWTESQEGGGAWQEGGGASENTLPISAARVFSPAPHEDSWETEKRPFLQQHFLEEAWPEETPPTTGCCCRSDRLVLKMLVSMATAALLFPFLVWGGFVFLPFDAPLIDGAAFRLVYALRCSVFGVLPVALGYLVLGISRLRSGELRPPCDASGCGEEMGAWPGDVSVHRSFVSDSTHLFLLYFLQLVVMATFLSQEQLKLVPLLTIIFCLGRLVYWVASAFQSSVRAFGFGLSFLPSLAMMAANIYFLVTMEMSAGVLAPPQTEQAPPPGRQRFWG